MDSTDLTVGGVEVYATRFDLSQTRTEREAAAKRIPSKPQDPHARYGPDAMAKRIKKDADA